MYCVYVTTYTGDKMPSKYIGSSNVSRVEAGYRGSVKSLKWKTIWDEELRTNADLFKTEIIETFDTRDDALVRELELQRFYNVVPSTEWINEAYACPNGYFGRDVSGDMNPMYGRGDKTREWCKQNPEAASQRSRKAAYTQWANEETRLSRIAAMKGKTKTFKDIDAYNELQRQKALKSKEKCAIKVEYYGVVYIGWRELYDATGVSKHLYKKYYMKGINPSERIGKNGPAPCSERR